MRVVVVGAGVIGLACAYSLRKRGCDVVVIEKGQPGHECSAGNAGWICPSHAEPLPAPGLTWTSIKWMLKRDSPLYISPAAVPRMTGFLWRFWRSCNARDFSRGLHALAELSHGTQAAFDALERDGVQFELHRDGLLCVFTDERAFASALAQHNESVDAGPHAESTPNGLTKTDVQRLEPALSDSVVGGFLLDREYHVRPESLAAGYARRLTECGVELLTGVSATGPAPGGVQTSAGFVPGDAVVVAAGAWSGRVLDAFGASLPVQAAKGYSLTVGSGRLPLRRPILLSEARVACTPFDGASRFAGTLELSGLNTELDTRRVGGIRNATTRYLRGALREGEGTAWVGMRPLTPDGLPLLGRAADQRNLFVATGHAMLGVTLAPVTGEHMADLITEGRASETLAPFDPRRFSLAGQR